MSPGALPSGGLVFQFVCFHRYWACGSKFTVWPMMESCFQNGACSVSSFTGWARRCETHVALLGSLLSLLTLEFEGTSFLWIQAHTLFVCEVLQALFGIYVKVSFQFRPCSVCEFAFGTSVSSWDQTISTKAGWKCHWLVPGKGCFGQWGLPRWLSG